MVLFLRLFIWLIALAVLALGAAVWLALGEEPAVGARPPLGHEDIAAARRIIERNDPRRMPRGSRQTVRLSDEDLELAANYLVQRVGAAAGVEVEDGLARISASLAVPHLPLRPYLNLRLAIAEAPAGFRFGGLKLGRLLLPDTLAEPLLRGLIGRLYGEDALRLAEQVIESVDFQPGRAAVTYVWRSELIAQARDSLLSGGVREALVQYHGHLTELQARGAGVRGSLVDLLPALFQEVQRRSRNADPVDENRALLLVLGAWASGRGMDKLVPPAQRGTRLRPFRLTLGGRKDLGQHFLVSAALAGAGDAILSDAVGLFKEVKDAGGSSGFSFTDLAADRAGTRFGELATTSSEQARRLQRELAAGVVESDLMPPVDGLPEHMGQDEFERRFGAVGSARYNEIMAEIEQRLARCRLLTR